MGFRRRELNKKLAQGIVEDEPWGRDDPEAMTRSKGLRAKPKVATDVDQRLYHLMLLMVFLIVGWMVVKMYLDSRSIHAHSK
jgi:hypothetical protein